MTHVYDWIALPRTLTVRCPTCSGPALLHRDEFLEPAPQKPTNKSPGRMLYAAVRGRLVCDRCHHVASEFETQWPGSAYFQCDVGGHHLWASSRAHLSAIRDYILSTTRDLHAYPGFYAELLHLPKHFTLAKNRDATVKAIEKLLRG